MCTLISTATIETKSILCIWHVQLAKCTLLSAQSTFNLAMLQFKELEWATTVTSLYPLNSSAYHHANAVAK